MDRGAWWAAVHGLAESQTRLSTHECTQNSGRIGPRMEPSQAGEN